MFTHFPLHPKSGPPPAALIDGPRFKSEASTHFEALVKNILADFDAKNEITVSYNSQNELVIKTKGLIYNVTQLLIHRPDFEHMQFSDIDLARYDRFLRDTKTSCPYIENDLPPEDLNRIKFLYPHLTSAEFTAIRYYTGTFYATIYHLFKYQGKVPYPSIDQLPRVPLYSDLAANLIAFASKLDPHYDQNHPTYNPSDPVFFTAVIREVLLHTTMSAAALSKIVAEQIQFVVAKTADDLNNHLNEISGIAFALVPTNQINPSSTNVLYLVSMIAYGKIVNTLDAPIPFQDWLNSDTKSSAGIEFSNEEINAVLTVLNSNTPFNFCDHLSALLRTKLVDLLTSHDNVKQLLEEKLYRYEEDPAYFAHEYVFDITSKLGTNQSYEFNSSFCSYSNELIDIFAQSDLNVVTTVSNPINFVKSIWPISIHPEEKERLMIPFQQIVYTSLSEHQTYVNGDLDKQYNLEGYPARSVSTEPCLYSHEACLFREKLIHLSDDLKQYHTPIIQPLLDLIYSTITCPVLLRAEEQQSQTCLRELFETIVLDYLRLPATGDKQIGSILKKFITDELEISLAQIQIMSANYYHVLLSDKFQKHLGCAGLIIGQDKKVDISNDPMLDIYTHKVLVGIDSYLTEPRDHLGFFAKHFDKERGLNRARIYEHILRDKDNLYTQQQKYLILLALLSYHEGTIFNNETKLQKKVAMELVGSTNVHQAKSVILNRLKFIDNTNQQDLLDIAQNIADFANDPPKDNNLALPDSVWEKKSIMHSYHCIARGHR